MSNILDAGQYVTELIPGVDKMKLYKICFFSQGWHLAWTGMPLFEEELQAWAKGPVPYDLRRSTENVARGWEVPHVPGGNSSVLSPFARATIESVVNFYGSLTSAELSDMSHGRAWQEARSNAVGGTHCSSALSMTTMREEFTELLQSGHSVPDSPSVPDADHLPSFDHLLATAHEVEAEWHNTLSLLADR